MEVTPVPGPPREPARDEAIAAAVAGLEGLDGLPVAEHVERFDTVHIALTAALATIDKV
ncbi:hypothetical protein V5P93_001926 [Actinokineospora auranticolor]|uniref:Uncharacterized protein n=1 Tax=Actinokineospora auranticolor TaxID=155976 RepID=A0A2S6GB01_9PSEU|nr:hypothetical protein [Actinokineospora auranticolor]PPK60494.1 hypothetical protein CLV40_1524 [Actinokineospora auranticolor]